MHTLENISDAKPVFHFSELNFAYLKPIMTNHGKKFAVYNAGGEQLAIFDNTEAAFFIARQHDIDLTLLH